MAEEKSKEDRQKEIAYKAHNKYVKKAMQPISIMVRKGKRDYYQLAAQKSGMSFAGFIQYCMDEKIKRDNLLPPWDPEQNYDKENADKN